MRRFLQITYKIQGSDYSTKEKIRALGDWMNYFDGSWLVLSRFTAKDAFDRITTNKPGDLFLITEVSVNNFWGVMPKEAWDWLQQKATEQGLP